jgi:YihY family inner membrane protein
MATVSNPDPSVATEPVGDVECAPDAQTQAAGAIKASGAAATIPGPPPGPVPAVTQSKWYRLRRDGSALMHYLLDSEVHTYAFSVAANAILSFIPFIVLLYTIALSVFHSTAMANVVTDLVLDFFPSTATPHFWSMLEGVVPRHVQVISLIMILISCTGIFLPLEVALNQAWGVAKSRNYLMNQTVAFGLALLMVVLGLISVVVTAFQRTVLTFVFFHHTDNFAFRGISYIWLALASGAACILFFFVIYWVLPNCKVPWRPVLRTSIVTGLIWLGAKYAFVLVLPHLDLRSMYGPFYVSVGLLMWAYVSGLILFAGAQYSVTRWGARKS